MLDVLSAFDCSKQVPDDWRDGVEGAAMPPPAASTGEWIAFSDAQTGQLDKANDRTASTIHIVAACEAREAEVAKALTPKPWYAGLAFWRR